MAVPSAYLTSVKNTAAIFAAVQKAGVPDNFTYEFLKQLGYASSSDRSTISVMKAIGFLDPGGRPTQIYREYKDPSLARSAMAKALRIAYKDLFTVDTTAPDRSFSELNGMFARLSDKGDSVTQKMAATFKTLCGLADFSAAPVEVPSEATAAPENNGAADEQPSPAVQAAPPLGATTGLSLRHDIHVHLPLSTDVAVYDAIFKSLKANLL